jgi:hypothetical protein
VTTMTALSAAPRSEADIMAALAAIRPRHQKDRLTIPQIHDLCDAYRIAKMRVVDISKSANVSTGRIWALLDLWAVPRRYSKTPAAALRVVPRETGNAILRAVCGVWGVTEWDIVDSWRRSHEESHPRWQAAMVAERKGYALTAIGAWLKRDHSSIHYARHQHKAMLKAAADGVGVSRYVPAHACSLYAMNWASVTRRLGIPA